MQESPYTLRGPLNAGTWRVTLSDSFPTTVDFIVHASLVRKSGAIEEMIVEMDVHVVGTQQMAPFGEATADAPAIAAQCGDRLLLRLEVTSGIAPGEGEALVARVLVP